MILTPVIKLIKLFMMVNSHKSISYIKDNCKELYEDVKKYYDFYTSELKDIYEILKLFFDDDVILDNDWNHNYKNAMSYQIVASKCYSEKKYIEAIFFSKCSKDILYNDLNFKRIISINRTIMGSYLYIGNYEECHKIAEKQVLYLQSIDFNEYEIKSAMIFEVVSLLGMEMYHEVIDKINRNDKMNLTIMTCLLVSLYQIDKNEYSKFYNDNIEYMNEDNKQYLI